MSRYACPVCGYIHDEDEGDPASGIAPGTGWRDIPPAWVCPVCGAPKSLFEPARGVQLVTPKEPAPVPESAEHDEAHDREDMSELSFGQLSALCSNLSKGCAKQYKAEEAQLFEQLADFYKSKMQPSETTELKDIAALVRRNLDSAYTEARDIATADRGALRALLWGEKVTKILNSLLDRYAKQGDALLETSRVWVCEICGFVFVGERLPEVCPVCKVPNKKFAEITRGQK